MMFLLLLSSVPSPRAKLLMPAVLWMALQLLMVTVTAFPVALPGCPETCGSITIPYPFGFQHGCYHAGFNLTCDETRHPPKLLLGDGVEVDDISLAASTVRVQSKITTFSWSYGNLTAQTANNRSAVKPSIDSSGLWYGGLTGTGMQLAVSTEHNVFVAIGCNFIAYLVANPDSAGGQEYVSACAALCDRSFPEPGDTSCSGVGCCRTPIAQALPAYGVQFKDLDQTDGGPSTHRPSVSAFIVDREWFSGINVSAMQNNTFSDSGSYIYGSHQHQRTSPKSITSVPTVLDWWLDLQRDRDLVVLDPHSGSALRCISLNSVAVETGGEISCNCSDGYEGNPYFVHGCQGYGVVFIANQDWFSKVGPMLQQNIGYPVVILMVLEWSLHMQRHKNTYFASNCTDSSQRKTCLNLNCIIVDNNNEKCGALQLRERIEGNPCMAKGCQHINECLQPDVYPCLHETCINMPGTYRCSAKKSIINLPGIITVIAISAGFGLLLSLLGVAQITNKLKQRKAKKLRQKFFKKNQGLLLQQLISSNKDIAERTRIFSLEELEQATNKFDHNRILGGGGHGTVYKGILSDQHVVAIKKAKIVVQREIEQFINEVVILSQTNHRNVVKLFGCCLETEVPLLVYEFVSNGTLSFHLHGQSENPFSWKDRLRIALETARAIAYLHSAASISVYHRDIKCANILLTDTLTAKVSDFGASRSIAIDETGILTAVQGTYGYLDPEYYYTSRLTEKSDVYSFGVILAELLTRLTPVFSSHSSEVTSLASHFVSLIRDNRLSDILDTQIVDEGGGDDAEAVARLAEACLSLKGEERPTMRQVETTLEDVLNSKVNLSSQITRVNKNARNDQSYKEIIGGEGTRLYSLEKEFIQSSEIPR